MIKKELCITIGISSVLLLIVIGLTWYSTTTKEEMRDRNYKIHIEKLTPSMYFKGYPHNGTYKKDLENVKATAIKHLKANKKTKKKAVVFDMDDTLVFTRPHNPLQPAYLSHSQEEPMFIFPPMEEIAEVARYAASNNTRVIIITARPPKSEKATWYNAKYYNIPVDEVYCDNSRGMNPAFKKQLRKELSKKYNILLTVGDRWGDVVDPNGALGIKLPSPDDTNIYLLQH